jgi:hypothetical protein
MASRKDLIIALTAIILAALLLSTIWLALRVESLNGEIREINNRTRMTLVFEMTANYVWIQFYGLNIEKVHAYTFNNESLVSWLYPQFQLNTLEVRKQDFHRADYLRWDLPIEAYISNDTIRMRIESAGATDKYTFTSLKILRHSGASVEIFNFTLTPNRGIFETKYVSSSLIR